MPLVFVSHAADDADQAKRLVEKLTPLLPTVRWFLSSTPESLPVGEFWAAEVLAKLRSAEVVLCCVSRQSIQRSWVWFEIGAAAGSGRPIVPVIIDGLPPREVPQPLSLFQVVSSRRSKHVADRISALVAGPTSTDGSSSAHGTIILDGSIRALDVGWEPYTGREGIIQRGPGWTYFGPTWDNGFRYPPGTDDLGASGRYIGFKARLVHELSIYFVVRGSAVNLTQKVFFTSLSQRWGFAEAPTDEFRVPIACEAGTELTVAFDLHSITDRMPWRPHAVAGFRVRGPIQLQQLFVADALFPDIADATVLRYP